MPYINNDPLGEALKDYANGHTSAEIIVHSSIAEDEILPASYLFRSKEELPELEKKALAYCKGKILDIGAGSGCHSLILQSNGFEVTAIDISDGAIEVMTKQGVKIVEKINVFEMKGSFDTLLMLMNGIGITGTIEGLTNFLQHAKNLLAPDGQILIESSDISYMFKEEDGSVWMDLNAAYYGEISYRMEYKNSISDTFDWLYIDFSTLKDHAADNGYDCQLLYEGETNFLAALTLV